MRQDLEAAGTRVAFVHMGTPEQGREHLARFGLDGAPQVSDPAREVYAAFGLRRGTVGDFVAPSVLTRGVSAILKGHGAGIPIGDVRQMPGVFVLERGAVVAGHRHKTVADRPDYRGLAGCTSDACALDT